MARVAKASSDGIGVAPPAALLASGRLGAGVDRHERFARGVAEELGDTPRARVASWTPPDGGPDLFAAVVL
jgi:hypothetical protein